MKIAILEICNQLWIGWTEKTMQIFCKYLDKEKFTVYACGVFGWGEREKLIQQHVQALLLANGDIEKIKQFVVEKNIHIVHWHSLTTNPWNSNTLSIELLRFFKKNHIRVVETAPFSLYNSEIDNLVDKKLFVSKNSLIKFFYRFAKKWIKREKYDFLYNPLDIQELKQYRISEEEKMQLRDKYCIERNAFVIGKIGRANLWKWDDTLIEIAFKLSKKIPNLKIVIRSIPPQRWKIIQEKKLDNLFLNLPETSNEQEICETYQLMDIMVHTSRIWESFGITLAEGMFFGLPIITKSTDFMRPTIFERDNSQIEIVENGINGFIENNNEKIIEKILELKNDSILYARIAQNNQQKAEMAFSAKKLCKKLEDFLGGSNNSPRYDNSSIREYKGKCSRENTISLLYTNFIAIRDKFIFKA